MVLYGSISGLRAFHLGLNGSIRIPLKSSIRDTSSLGVPCHVIPLAETREGNVQFLARALGFNPINPTP